LVRKLWNIDVMKSQRFLAGNVEMSASVHCDFWISLPSIRVCF